MRKDDRPPRDRRTWRRIAGPLVMGVALGVALDVFLHQLPYWLAVPLVIAFCVAAWWWAWRQYQWARAQLRALKEDDDG